MKLKLNLKYIIIITLFLSLINSSQAISAGVSPPKINIENAIPDNIYNLTFTVYNMGNETTNYSIILKGNTSNWTYLDKSSVEVKGNSSYPIYGKVKIPKDIINGTYKGNIIIKSIPSDSITGNKVSVGVQLPITINVSRMSKIKESIEPANISNKPSDNETSVDLNNRQTANVIIGILIIIIAVLLFKNKRRKQI